MIYYLSETDQFKNTRAVLHTSYLKMENVCLQMYYILVGAGTSLTVNAIHERDRHTDKVLTLKDLY